MPRARPRSGGAEYEEVHHELVPVRPDRTTRARHRLKPRHRLGDRDRPCKGRGDRDPQRPQHGRTGEGATRPRRRRTIRSCPRLRRRRSDCGGCRRRCDRRRDRPDRHPLQQCRHTAAPATHRNAARDLARSDGDQPRQRLLRWAGRGAAHDPPRPRQDRQHLLARKRSGTPDHRPLRRRQGRGEDADQVDVRRACAISGFRRTESGRATSRPN